MPESAPGTSIGIDIGMSECKLVEISSTSGSFMLLKAGIEPSVAGDATGAIKKLLNKFEVPPKRVYTSVSGKGTLVRYIDMPRMSAEELNNSFNLEADKYFPFPLEQIYTDCFINDPQGKNKQMKVIAVAAKKELVDERLKLIQSCGLVTDFVGVNPLALANALHVLGPPKECPTEAENLAIIDIGDLASNLTIVVNKVPLFSRDIFIGSREFTKSIGHAFGLNISEADTIKVQPGGRLEEVHSAIESVVLNLAKEIRLSFDYFTTEYNKEVHGLLLTGGGALLPGLHENLANILEIQVWPWNPLLSLTATEDVSQEIIKSNGMKLGAALGLALYDYD